MPACSSAADSWRDDSCPGSAASGNHSSTRSSCVTTRVGLRRACCAKALRHYGDDASRKALLACLTDKDFTVRYQAHASLVALTGRDAGWEPEDWAKAAPVTQPTRPWWDWMGATDDKP